MKSSKIQLLLIPSIILFLFQGTPITGQSKKIDRVKEDIKTALVLETQYFYQRDMPKWQNQWSHGPQVMKCYVRDGQYSEQLGWAVIRKSAEDYMKEHPHQEQVPSHTPDYDIRVAGASAFVSFIQLDPKRGKKREIRFMVKEKGQWKIAYMGTYYYPE